LRSRPVFAAYLAPLRKKNWFVHGKPPFAGPEAVLAYLARYTHRVAISNSRLIGLDDPSWEAFGRRPSARADRSPRARIRNPSPKRTSSVTLKIDRVRAA
jgi:hypothetical protein